MIKNEKRKNGVLFFSALAVFFILLMITAELKPDVFKNKYTGLYLNHSFEDLMGSHNLTKAMETMLCAGIISQTGEKTDEDRRNHLTKNAFIFSKESGENIEDLILAYSKGIQASYVFKNAGDVQSLEAIFDKCRSFPLLLPNQKTKSEI